MGSNLAHESHSLQARKRRHSDFPTIRPDGSCQRCARFHTLPRAQSSRKLSHRRQIRETMGFREQIIGQRNSFQSSPGFQFPMQFVRHVANLNHLGHAKMIFACLPHVKRQQLWAPDARRRFESPTALSQTPSGGRGLLWLLLYRKLEGDDAEIKQRAAALGMTGAVNAAIIHKCAPSVSARRCREDPL
jgi:hypothetical protein